MKSRARFAVPLLLVLGVIAWLLLSDESESETGVSASGTVEATDADLGFQMPGRISSIAVDEGDQVFAGDELARLDTGELTASRAAAAAQLTAAEARLAELRQGGRPQEIAQGEAVVRAASEQALDARREVARAQRLFDGGAISRQALDRARTTAEVADATLEQAEQRLAIVVEGPREETVRAQAAATEQARANLLRVDVQLANASIVAPFAGNISLRHREPGEIVGGGAPVVSLQDLNDRWVRIYVREDQIGRIQLGMAARITSDTYPDRMYEGEVVFIGNEAEFTPRNVQTTEERIRLVYPVRVRITGDPGVVLRPGIPADVVLSEGSGS